MGLDQSSSASHLGNSPIFPFPYKSIVQSALMVSVRAFVSIILLLEKFLFSSLGCFIFQSLSPCCHFVP